MKILFRNTTKYNKEIYQEFLEFHKNKYQFSYILYTALVLIAFFFCFAMQVKYHNYNIAILFAIGLYIDKTHAYLLDKSGFTKGTVDEFSDFIKKRCWWRFKSK